MREFLLSVTIVNLSQPALVDFIVSDSLKPPSWGSVKNNPAKITRTFNDTDKKTRKIYFSITDQYVAKKSSVDVTRVDLSATKTKEEEDEKSKEEAPGFMLPANTYHVYAYSNGVFVKTSEPVTTLGYPTTPFPKQYNDDPNNKPFGDDPKYSDYTFNMVWITGNPLEVGTHDVAYIPFRYLSILDQSSSGVIALCSRNAHRDTLISFAKRPEVGDLYESVFAFDLGQLKDISNGAPTFFVASPQLKVTPESNRNQVLDVMARIKVGSLTSQMITPCFDPLGPAPIDRDGIPQFDYKYVDD